MQGGSSANSAIPLWPVVTVDGLLKALERTDITSVAVYSLADLAWKKVQHDYTIQLTNGATLLLKKWGVKWCAGIDDILERLQRGTSSTAPLHLFKDITANRASVRKQLNSTLPATIASASATVPSPPAAPPLLLPKHHIKQETEFTLPPAKHPCVTTDAKGSRTLKHLHVANAEGSYSHTQLSSRIASQESSADSWSTLEGLMSPAPSSKWPNGRYTIDIVKGLREMRTTYKDLRQQDQFTSVFGDVPWVPSTYHNAVERWRRAPEELRVQLLVAGRTPAGLWDLLRKEVRLKEVKPASRPRPCAHVHVKLEPQESTMASPGSVINISDDSDSTSVKRGCRMNKGKAKAITPDTVIEISDDDDDDE